MKLLKIVLSGTVIVVSLTVFAQEDKKAAKVRQELSEAKADSVADFLKLKQEAETTISKNKEKIAALKAKKSDTTKETNEKYNKKVLALEQKNNALKRKIDECNTTKTDAWSSFKLGFNRDMNALGDALTNMEIEMYKVEK
jgi:hypothetical protein